MEELVKLVILSHKRADKVDTLKTISNCSLCVPESQAADYKKYNPGVEIIAHPDSIVGLSPKIRWVYAKYKNVVMLDDDLNGMTRNYVDKDFELRGRVDKDTAYEILQHSAYMTKQLGAFFFGFSNSPRPVDFSPMQPIKLSGFVQGGALGFLDGFKMHLPDECKSACDYYLSGVNAYFHRKAYIDMRYAFTSKEGTFKSTGGMADIRTKDTEREDYLLLKKAFGPAIVKKTTSSLKPIQNKYERTLRIPF